MCKSNKFKASYICHIYIYIYIYIYLHLSPFWHVVVLVVQLYWKQRQIENGDTPKWCVAVLDVSPFWPVPHCRWYCLQHVLFCWLWKYSVAVPCHQVSAVRTSCCRASGSCSLTSGSLTAAWRSSLMSSRWHQTTQVTLSSACCVSAATLPVTSSRQCHHCVISVLHMCH